MVIELEDQIASLQTDLLSAQTLSSGLQDSLSAARDRTAALAEAAAALQPVVESLNNQTSALRLEIATLEEEATLTEEEVATLEEQVASLQRELAEQPEVLSPERSDQPSLATQDEIDGLNTTIAQLNTAVSRLNVTVAQREENLAALDAQLAAALVNLRGSESDLRNAENQRDSTETELAAAEEQIGGLRDQIANLRNQRDAVSGESTTLESQVSQLNEEVALLEAYRARIEAMTERYERVQAAAVRLAAEGNFDLARDRILSPLRTATANEILPGLATSVEGIYAGLIAEAEVQTAEEVRIAAFEDVAGLADRVKRNIDDAKGSAAVQSYIQREPDIEPIANEIFEIIELAARDISATELQYKLLGSVSRITGNLVVVEHLVAIDTSVGGSVEIRRTPQLGQEVPVALGIILEVTDRRVVVSVDQIYQLDVPPEVLDVVYLAQE